MMSRVIFILLVSLASCAWASPSDPVPRPEQWWMDRHNSFVQNTIISNGSIPIVFIGASITEGWQTDGKPVWDEQYVPLGATNYGIGGDKVEHVIWRALNGEFQGLSPKVIAIQVGGNNINGGGDTDDEIIAGLGRLTTTLTNMMPRTKVLLFGMFPSYTDTFVRVANVNIGLAKLDNGDSVRFLNMFDQFAQSWGSIRPELYQSDSLHFITAGYEQWHRSMTHIFHEMLEE